MYSQRYCPTPGHHGGPWLGSGCAGEEGRSVGFIRRALLFVFGGICPASLNICRGEYQTRRTVNVRHAGRRQTAAEGGVFYPNVSPSEVHTGSAGQSCVSTLLWASPGLSAGLISVTFCFSPMDCRKSISSSGFAKSDALPEEEKSEFHFLKVPLAVFSNNNLCGSQISLMPLPR